MKVINNWVRLVACRIILSKKAVSGIVYQLFRGFHMAQRCDNCGRGRDIGKNVSHAKNRTFRLFRPNLQKLRVLKEGISIHVKFCTSCIQRLKKDGQLGSFLAIKYAVAKVQPATQPVASVPSKKNIDREAKKIEEIMKKVEEERKEVEKVVKVEAKKKAEEKIKIEELVGTLRKDSGQEK